MLASAAEGGVFLLTTSQPKEKVWDSLPLEMQRQLIEKKMRLFIIDAVALAEELGLGSRINMIMQTAFFVISEIIPKEDAIRSIKEQIKKTYTKKGEEVVKMNYASVDAGASQYRRSARAGQRNRQADARPRCAGFAALRQGRPGAYDRDEGRRPARIRHAGGRHLADRHDTV